MSEYQDPEVQEEFYEESGVPSYEDVMAARRISLRDVKDHITGPVVSVLAHIILLAFVSTLVVFEAPVEREELEVEFREMELYEPPEMPKPPPIPDDYDPEPELDEDFEPHIEDPVLEKNQIPYDEPFSEKSAIDPLPQFNYEQFTLTDSAKLLPTAFSGRDPGGRKMAQKRYNPNGPSTERPVKNALRWLRDHQNPDGSWGDGNPQYSSALSAIALLAFLAHGETPRSAEFGACVLKAIRRLVEWVESGNGYVRGKYNHGMVMYALSEAYALTQIPMLEEVMNKGVTKVVQGQNSLGSYNYDYNNSKLRSDLSVAGWNYQCLKAAFAAGSTASGLEQAIEKGITAMKTSHYREGKFCYGVDGQGAKKSMTSVGVLCLQLFGEGVSREALAGLKNLKSPKWFSFDWDAKEQWAMYNWYYQTQAIFQGESESRVWKAWNKMFSNTLVAKQKSDGRWETPAAEKHGADGGGHGEANFEGLDGPVYATALSCLMLQVYHRYLPTFKLAEARPPTAADAATDSGDDLGLEVE